MTLVRKLIAIVHLPLAYSMWRLRVFYWRLRGARIEERVYLSPGFRVLGNPAGVSIARGTSVGKVTFHAHAPIRVGSNAVINDGSEIIAGTHDTESPEFVLLPKEVEIGDHAWIATRAIVLPGCRIGNRAVVGAGAVVVSNVPDGAVVAGNPARVIRERKRSDFTYEPFSFHPVSLRRFFGRRL
jgi:acetyltransferase-like isoleucine patch superfamily enzyme